MQEFGIRAKLIKLTKSTMTEKIIYFKDPRKVVIRLQFEFAYLQLCSYMVYRHRIHWCTVQYKAQQQLQRPQPHSDTHRTVMSQPQLQQQHVSIVSLVVELNFPGRWLPDMVIDKDIQVES